MTQMAKILGGMTTYHGTEHPYLRGLKVRIVAAIKRAAAPDHDPDRDDSYLRDEDAISRAGGVTAEATERVRKQVRALGSTDMVLLVSRRPRLKFLLEDCLRSVRARTPRTFSETRKNLPFWLSSGITDQLARRLLESIRVDSAAGAHHRGNAKAGLTVFFGGH
jgi:hypothetical protein